MKQIIIRKKQLVERIALQRAELATVLQNLEQSFSIFDQGYGFAQEIRKHSLWVTSSCLLLALIFRKRVYAMIKRIPLLALCGWLLQL